MSMQGWQEDGVKVPYKLTTSVTNCLVILTSENTFHLRGFFVDHLRTTMICRYTLLRYEDLVADFESTVSVLFFSSRHSLDRRDKVSLYVFSLFILISGKWCSPTHMLQKKTTKSFTAPSGFVSTYKTANDYVMVQESGL